MATLADSEVDSFLNTVSHCHGYDFHHYAKSSLLRRINGFMSREGFSTVEELNHAVSCDEQFMSRFLAGLSVGVTAMFRDPGFYLDVRLNVVPYLKTFPFFKIWLAGCSTGEEVYSLAILLKEEGVYDRAMIYATDINDGFVAKAREGVFREVDVNKYCKDYELSGGKNDINDYFCSKYGFSKAHDELKGRVVFSSHNLVSDGSFGVMQLIFCRNVIIYFDEILKRRVVNLFSECLDNGGVVCLGSKESLEYIDRGEEFELVGKLGRIYKKRVPMDVH